MKNLLVQVLVLFGGLWISGQRDIPQFQEVREESGLTVQVVSGNSDKHYLVESVGGGLAIIDYDGDGWMDLYIVNGQTLNSFRDPDPGIYNRLYRNNQDGTFEDVSKEAGVDDTGWGKGALVADFNNDGYDDLYILNWGPNVLYRNNGDGTFTDVTAKSGLGDPRWSSSAAAADYDQDGDLDLFVANYLHYDIDHLPVEGKFCSYREIPVACGPRGLEGAPDRLFRNDGDFVFTDVSAEAGVADQAGYYGLGAIWGDYDNDGDLDLYVANDSTPNYLYQNQGDGRFVEVGAESGVAYSDDGREQAGMGVDFADYDNDGWLDLVVTNFSHDYNTIYRNTGKGYFIDASFSSGVAAATQPDLSWGVSFSDFNNDGLKDLFIANGHIYPQLDNYGLNVFYRQPNRLFLNRGQNFEEINQLAGEAFSVARSTRGAVFGDFDNNGLLDIALVELDDTPTLLVNQTSTQNGWLLLHLEGVQSNRNAVGSRIKIQTGDVTQIREIQAGGTYAGSNDFRAHFGLGRHSQINRIEIRWPSGKISTLENIPANQILKLNEPE